MRLVTSVAASDTDDGRNYIRPLKKTTKAVTSSTTTAGDGGEGTVVVARKRKSRWGPIEEELHGGAKVEGKTDGANANAHFGEGLDAVARIEVKIEGETDGEHAIAHLSVHEMIEIALARFDSIANVRRFRSVFNAND